MKRFGFTNNQLKMIAMVTMTVDHIGMIFFPYNLLWRAVGRLAFPIYAFMIAEGCRHTRSMGKYLASLGVLAAVCQIVAFIATGTLALNILATFSFSVFLIMLLKSAGEKKTVISWVLFAAALAAVFCVAEVLPRLLEETGFYVEYDFLGIILPVCVYAAGSLPVQLLASGACLALMSCYMWQGQWLSLLALPLLAFYNGQRGKWKLKWVFYFYYPVHLGVLWVLAAIL